MQKTNFKTRLLALLTAVFMVIVSIPFAAFADNGFTVSFFDVETKTAVGDTFTMNFDPTDNKVEVSNDVAKGTVTIKDEDHEAQTIYAPDGYKVKDLGGHFITDGKLVLDVVKVTAQPEAGFTVSFIDRDTKKSVGETYTFKFDATDNKINVSSTDGGKTLVIKDGTHEAQTIFAPDGYQLNVKGDYTVEDGKVVLSVDKIPEPEAGFTINFVDDKGKVSDLTFTFKFNPTDNKVEITTNDDGKTATVTDGTHEPQTIYAPDGYKIVTRGGQLVENGVVSLKIAKIETKPTTKFYVMFKDGETISGLKYGFKYDPEDGKVNISSKDKGVTLTIDEGTSHQQTFKAPEGYRVTKLGGFFVEDGKVILNIEKIPTQKSVALNYILDGKTVGTTTLMVNADATKIEIRNNDGVVTANGQQIIAPEGYVFCNFGDFFIEQDKNGVNYVNLSIAAGTKEITLTYYVEGTDKNETVGTEKHTVATNATKVEVREVNGKFTADGVAITAPNGYKLVVKGDFFIENNNVNLKVVKVESKNNSSSSSSSSNKTTTASSKAEQKVVKAAAAPANTTKVLPKTGASNVAPLLGGSLAVVALLMGYGVYSLVLRKKD